MLARPNLAIEPGSEAIPGGAADNESFSLRGVGRSAAIIAGATVVGQLAVIGRELFVAANEGTSAALDALLVAIVLPVFMAGIIFSGVQAALVPAYLDAERAAGRTAARGFAAGLLGWSLVLGSVAVIVALGVAGPALQIAGPGLSADQREDAIGYMPLLLSLIVITPLGTILAGICQAHRHFKAIATSIAAGSITSAVITVALWDSVGLWALAAAYVANAGAVALVLAAALARRRWLPVPSLRLDLARTKAFMRHLAPLTAGSAVLQLNLVADRAVASLVGAGGVSALRYGDQLVQAPLNAVSAGWSTVIYPALVATTHGDERAIGEATTRSLKLVAGAFIPIAALIAALAPLIVGIVYERGAFDRRAAEQTSAVLAAFAPLLPLLMANSVLVSAHNARRRGVFVGAIAVANAALNLALNLALAPLIGVAGIALSTSFTIGLLVTVLAWRMSSTEIGFDGRAVARTTARAIIGTIVAIVPVSIMAWSGVLAGSPFPIAIAWLMGMSMWAALVYLAMAATIGLREPIMVVIAIGGAIRSRRDPGPAQ